jgi:putative ubiquitin-RnfH superfamily antitoxin RatB of RatAB toxin-antitoxin module
MTMLRVVVAWSPGPRQVRECGVELEEGSTPRDAVAAAGLAPQEEASVGIWGRKCGWDQVLREGDRVELYRALVVDPKVARRERFRGQGARATGLFARKRPGAKPGY